MERHYDQPLGSPLRPRANRRPHHLLSAEDDLYGMFRSARYTAEHIAGARFVNFPTGGHLLLGHWKEACAQVAGFLGGQSAKGSGPQ